MKGLSFDAILALAREPYLQRAAVVYALVLLVVVLGLFSGEYTLFFDEDGILEWLEPLFFLSAGVLYLYAAVRFVPPHQKRWTSLPGLFFLVLALDELSWGLRFLGMEKPLLFGVPIDGLHDMANYIWRPLIDMLGSKPAFLAMLFLALLVLALLHRPLYRFWKKEKTPSETLLMLGFFFLFFGFVADLTPHMWAEEMLETLAASSFVLSGISLVAETHR